MRKHENFHWGGYKYAPESVGFYINGKHINFPRRSKKSLGIFDSMRRERKVVD